MKSYVVTSGTYSDYHIIGVFLSKDKAEEYVDMYNLTNTWNEACIEEYEVGFTETTDDKIPFFIFRNQEGNVVALLKDEVDKNSKSVLLNVPYNVIEKGKTIYTWEEDIMPEIMNYILGSKFIDSWSLKNYKDAVKFWKDEKDSYCVVYVHHNINHEVMRKAAIDYYYQWKAEKEGV